MFHNILVPLDGSKLAERALPYAKFLATALELPVDLLHVHDPQTAAPAAYSMPGAGYLEQVAATLAPSLTVNCCVAGGSAAEVIVDNASRDANTLIMMATHGRSGAQRWLLGSVAQKVLQVSINPLLLIRPTQETRPEAEARLSAVIIPLDGSHLAEKIFTPVIYLANRLRLQVVLIRTYTLPTTGYFMAAGISPPALGELGAKIKQEATAYLQAKVEQLQAEGIEKVSSVVAAGRAPEAIIDLARGTANAMVAMSTHGRSGIGRWVLGSVADRVVSYCGNPVLVVRPASSQEKIGNTAP
jgi:nucleotide-binding universal stress UspA family protein